MPEILHYTSPGKPLTKYDMTEIIASHLVLPIKHVIADKNKPEVKPGQTERPENTQLSTKSLRDIGVDDREDQTFDQWWGQYVKAAKQ